jgi:cyclohexyl-isocyanide hydratase
MRLAFVAYDGMTALDFIGVYDPLIRLKTMGFVKDLDWEICARTDVVVESGGLAFIPTEVARPFQGYDVLIVPGGLGSRVLVASSEFVEWLKTGSACKIKASVCTGALLLGAAGYLTGRRATTHPSAFGELRPYCGCVVEQRIVEDGDVITAGGVTSSIDLGLYLCEKVAGREAREKIRLRIDYPSTNEFCGP